MKTVQIPPFPPLFWDGFYWQAAFEVPWYANSETPRLVIRPDYSRSIESKEIEAAPRPTEAQTAAFQFLLDPQTPLKTSLLAEFLKYIPELEGGDWQAVQNLFMLGTVLLFHPALEGIAYTGFVFHCLQYNYGYEHGVGIVTHRERVVHFGMTEEAQDEQQARKDLRRIARKRHEK